MIVKNLTRELNTDIGMIQVVMGGEEMPGHTLAFGQTVQFGCGTAHDLQESILAIYVVAGMEGIWIVALHVNWTAPDR